MAYDSGKRLLLYALVKGLGDAARRNDTRRGALLPMLLSWRTSCEALLMPTLAGGNPFFSN